MENMLRLRYETDMPAGDQIVYVSCNVSINKGEIKNNKKNKPLSNICKYWREVRYFTPCTPHLLGLRALLADSALYSHYTE